MAASEFESVTLEGMARSSDIHLQTAEHVASSRVRMESLAEQAKAGWTGEAGNNFQAALDAWMSNYRIVSDVLEDMLQAMGISLNQYTGTHEATSDATKQVAATMAEPIGLTGF
ncbi:WXG100 family type VII secretion target [Streptomyces sp. CRN 30]|uniref:WXG100 family type VII secretion target n=1 Tax=Streptomyces sp. CRN 30 TaxID=3075613 RepID=UPI002A838B8E|nr:WXG100 family type VII secretion target [Streptomyces sp. CRN 30]